MGEEFRCEGSGQNVTKITGLSPGGTGIMRLAYNSELRNITVENTGYSGSPTAFTLSVDGYNPVVPFGTVKLSDVKVINSVSGAYGRWGMDYNNVNVLLKNVSIDVINGYGIQTGNSTTKADNLSITSTSSNVAIGVFATWANFVMKNSSINAVGQPYGIAVQNNKTTNGGQVSEQNLGHTTIVNTVIESGIIYDGYEGTPTITCAGVFDGAYTFFANTCPYPYVP